MPPGVGAAVMALGVLSADAAGVHLGWLGLALAGAAAAVWLVLGVAAAPAARGLLSTPHPPSVLTAVAGTAVLGSRVAAAGGRTALLAAGVLYGGALLLWAAVLPGVVRGLPRPAAGAVFLLTVAPQALAVLAGDLARAVPSRLLGATGTVLAVAGLAAYPAALARFDRRDVGRALGDQWVAGGALAVSALAAGTLAGAPGAPPGLGVVGLALWLLAAAWYPVLLAGELVRPRLRFDVRRWATAFPLGMLPAAGLVVAQADGLDWLRAVATGLVWPALVAGAVVAAGALRALVRALVRDRVRR